MVHKFTAILITIVLTLWLGLNSLSESATMDAIRQAELNHTVSLIKRLPFVKCSADMVELYARMINQYVAKERRPVMVAIIYVESKFDYKAINNGQDFGVAQIHHPIWGKVFGVSKDDLLNPSVNIKIAGKILKTTYERHGKRNDWYSFYHSHNRIPRQKYTKLINNVLNKIGCNEYTKRK